jgi:hypothetical protein
MTGLRRTESGALVYEPDGEVLSRFFWDRSKLSVIQGPIGSGTSSASVHKIWAIANEQPPDVDGVRRTRWIVTRNTYKELDTTLLATTWPQWFPERAWGTMVRSEPRQHTLKRPHWSGDGTTVEAEVVFLALPDEQVAEKVLASFEITGFFINEGQFVPLGVVTELLSRCSRYPSKMNGPGAKWFGGFIDLNAPEEGHWIPYMRGDLPVPADWDDDRKMQFEKPADWKFFVQPPGLIEEMVEGRPRYRPNPKAENQKWLTEPYIEKIRGWDKDKIDRRVLNKVGLSRHGKPVYPTFLVSDHVLAADAQPVEGLDLIVGLDFGREPAAVFLQNRSDRWLVLSELIGSNESAAIFAPRVARHLAQRYPGFRYRFYGDPRGADRTQSSEVTAYDVFRNEGMNVMPASSDNNPEIRRSTVERVLGRRYGLQINPSCLTLKAGMAGGYHYRSIKGINGMFTDRPVKNLYSHVVEAMENGLMGGGEAMAVTRGNIVVPKASPMVKRRVNWRS